MNRDNDKGKILIGRTLVWVGVQFAMLLLIIVRLYYLQVYQADKFSTCLLYTSPSPRDS